MEQKRNSDDRIGGPYMVQDQDHMPALAPAPAPHGAKRKSGRQVEQSQSTDRQQGSNDDRPSRQQGGERRQSH